MKPLRYLIILWICSMQFAQAQAGKDSLTNLQMSALKQADLRDYQSFKRSVKPLIKAMSGKDIIGLGEGTHGTAEFYTVRFWLSRILIEEKGFTQIAFENDYSDSWLLDQQLNTAADLDSLMRKHLLKIWQNKETRDLLAWVRSYNRGRKRKVTISGIDYVYARPDVVLLQQQLAGTPVAYLLDSLPLIARAAALQDEAWEGTNQKEYRTNMDSLSKSSSRAYLAAERLAEAIERTELPAAQKRVLYLAAQNLKQAFAPFYGMMSKKNVEEATRDSLMSFNTSVLMQEPGTKIIIWAHNAHVAKTGIYDNVAGGAGGFIARAFPGKYFVLGTGTATGTFAATTDPRDTYDNVMQAYPLELPLKNSWEEILTVNNRPAVFFETPKFNPKAERRGLRFIGYGPKSGASTYDQTDITRHFDAFLFIKNTHAATPLDEKAK